MTAFNKISPSTEGFQETIPICWPPGNIYIQGSEGIGEEHAGWRENGEEREWGVSLFLPLLAIPAPSDLMRTLQGNESMFEWRRGGVHW